MRWLSYYIYANVVTNKLWQMRRDKTQQIGTSLLAFSISYQQHSQVNPSNVGPIYIRIWSPPCFQMSLQRRHNDHDRVSNHRPHDCLLNRLFRRRSKKTSKLRVTGLCAGNSPVTGEFPAQMASDSGNVSILWRHHIWQAWCRQNYTHFLQGHFH